jgi:hypothetical protein
MVIITTAISRTVFIITSWVRTHFGKNHKNGGSPLKGESVVGVISFTTTVFRVLLLLSLLLLLH